MSEAQIKIVLSLTGAIIACALWHLRLHFPFDDTFISFRYTQHVAAGHGLVWNIDGPHTEGFTNLLFVLVLAVAGFFTSDLLAASQIIGLVATILSGLSIFSIACRVRNTSTGLLAVVFFWLTPLTWINALSGMETSFFVMLCLLSINQVLQEHYYAGFAAAFFAALTRPEAVLLGLIIFLVAIALKRHSDIAKAPLWKAAICFVLAIGLFAVWKWWYFGGLFPNSFYVKVLTGTNTVLCGLQYVRLFVISVLVLIVLSFGIRQWKNSAVLIAMSWALLLLLFYLFVLPLEGLYDRFLWPAFSMLCITAAVGTYDFVERRNLHPFWTLGAIVTLMQVTLSLLSPRTKQSFAAHEEIWDASLDPIVYILQSLPHRDSLLFAYGDAGYVVYKSGINHIDLFGLNDTRIAHARKIQDRAAIILSEHPDILLLPVFVRDSCFDWVEDAYGLARSNNFTPIASTDAFPFRLVWLLNKQSRYYSDCKQWMLRTTLDKSSVLQSAPPMCYSTR